MTGDQLDWVTSLAYSLSLVCDLCSLHMFHFGHSRLHGTTASECHFSTESKTDRRRRQKNPSTPVWKTSAVLVCLCLEQGVSRPPFCSVRTDACFQTGCGLRLTARRESWCFQKLFFSWPLTSARFSCGHCHGCVLVWFYFLSVWLLLFFLVCLFLRREMWLVLFHSELGNFLKVTSWCFAT